MGFGILGPLTSSGLTTQQSAQLQAIADKVATIGAGNITITSPVGSSGDVTLTAGDTYTAAAGRALLFGSDAWPSLAGATVSITATSRQTGIMITYPLTIIQAAGPGQVQLELTNAQTSSLERGDNAYRYSINAILPDHTTVTLINAHITVR